MFSEQIFCLIFKLWKFLLKYNKFFKLRARKFCFPKYKKLSKRVFFSFFELASSLLKYKTFCRISVSWNIGKFYFQKCKKSFSLTKYKKFFQRWIFLFFELGLKSALSSYFCKTFQRCFAYTKILRMLLLLNMPEF